ncbi:NADH-quinone oxidoreductase subunit A [Glycomyces arizonensis]|uniref:NADH-quinone oxidoreductase subunit A n=1 Tax=Glycomyces arizonensis TaxID=256035 RepID=UPI0003FA8DA0|nr:NADH-quinone oxidoreductase subunit A [Glycomyces arizonensis]
MDSSHLGDYAVFGVLLLAGFAFVAAAMTANRLLRPAPRSPRDAPRHGGPAEVKGSTYECGVDLASDHLASPHAPHVGDNWAQVQIRYYVYAFLFVLFAVEAVFLFPWAAVFAAFGAAAAVEMGLFVGVLALGLAHAWRKGVLRWA